MSEIIGISATELERLSVLALSGTPALSAGQVYDVDGQRYRWTGTAWEKRWRSQWLPVRAETNEAGEVVRVATSTIDLPVVTYQTSPGGGIALSVGGVSAELPEIAAAQSAATLASATAALTPVLTDEREYIQGYYVKVGGTRTTGRSTPGDWSDANCYGDIQTAVDQGWTSDDWIVLDDAAWQMTVVALATTTAVTGSRLKMRSRSLDRSACSLRFTDTSAAGWRFNRSDRSYGLDVRGITVSADPHTTAAAPVFLQVWQPSDALMTFTDMDFIDAAINHPSNVSLHGFFNAQIGSAGARTVRFTRCRFYGLSANVHAGAWFLRGLSGTHYEFIDCDFGLGTDPGAGITAAAHAPSSGFVGGVGGGVDITLTGCRQNGVTITSASVEDVVCYPLFTVSGTLVIDGFEVRNTTVTGASAGTFGVMARGPHTVKKLHGYDCMSTPADTINSVGGLFTAFGEAAVGTAEEIVAERCVSDFGTALYWSQGASNTTKAVVAIECRSRVDSIVYSGGWGDTTGVGIVGVNCRYGTGSNHPSLGDSGFLHAHNHTTLATRTKTATYQHVRLVGCRNMDVKADGSDTLFAHSRNATYGLNLVLHDIVADGAPGNHVRLDGANGSTFTVSGDVSLPGGNASVIYSGNITGALNVLGNVTAFPRAPTREEAIAWARHVAGI